MSIDPATMEELLASETVQRSLRPLRVGETVEGAVAAVAIVAKPEDPDGRVVLSLRRARNRRQWTPLEEMKKSGSAIDALVLEANRRGVVVDVGLRGFVPLWQLSSIGAIDVPAPGIHESVKALVGKRLRVRVLEADPRRERLILSEKAAAQQLRRDRKARGATALKAMCSAARSSE